MKDRNAREPNAIRSVRRGPEDEAVDMLAGDGWILPRAEAEAAGLVPRDRGFDVTNDEGRPFFVRLVRKGERYGRNDCLIHDEDDPSIEFYDRSPTILSNPAFQPRGQFVSSYYARTLGEKALHTGIDLCGHVPEWKIDGDALLPVLYLARAVMVPAAPEYTPAEAARLREGMSKE